MIVARATGYKIDHCKGCLNSLFQTKANPFIGNKEVPVQVFTSDAGKIVAAHIDEMKFKDVLKQTIPNTNDLKEIYSAPALDYEMVMEKLKLCIGKVVMELVPAPVVRTTEEITEDIAKQVSQIKLTKMMEERNQNLIEKREMILNKFVHSMINEMWTITSNKIRDMPLDPENVDKTIYRQMIKELTPELAQSTNYRSVQKTLMYPVITDELNLIIRNNNDTGSVHELTDKMFDKLTPFIREGLMMEITPLDTPVLKEDIADDIKNVFASSIEMSTKEGLIIAGKIQTILNEENENPEMANEFMEIIKPYLSDGVEVEMNWLMSKGKSYKDARSKQFLFTFLFSDVNWPTKKDLFQHYSKQSFAEKFTKLTSSQKPFPEDIQAINMYMTQLIMPMMQEFISNEIDEFRRQNPQLSKCQTSVVAAQTYGELKMEILALTKEYIESMAESDMNENVAADYVLEKIMQSLLKKLEEAGEESGDFVPGKFMQSDVFNDAKAQLESQIRSTVMKQLTKME